MVIKSLIENKKILAAIIGVAVMVVGGSVFGIYKLNATQVEQVAEAQETIDVDALAEIYYNENKDNIKSDTTLEDWTTVFKDYWASTNADESATVRDCLNYFAPDTILPGDVEDPESMEVKVDEEDAALVTAEMIGDDEDITEEVTTEVGSESAASSATTDASTDTVTADDFEIDYYDESKTMYAIRSVNVRKGPSTDYDKVKTLSTNASVTVIGVVNEYNGEDVYWTVVKIDDTDNEYFISGVYLSDTKVSTTTSSSSSTTSSGSSSTSSGTTSSSSTQSNTSSNSSNSSARDKLKNAQHDSGNNVQSGGSGDGTGSGSTGINWH